MAGLWGPALHWDRYLAMPCLLLRAQWGPMRTTLAIDDGLLAKAAGLTGLKKPEALVREAVKALIERESARRLARLGGSKAGLPWREVIEAP